MTLTYGVHSEAGVLRRVMVHRPGSEMARLTPANCESLLFDDVLWVKQARIDHMAFVDVLRERGVEVVMLRQMLEDVLHHPGARRWLLEQRINDNSVGVGLSDDLLACLMEMPAEPLSNILIGGMSRAELPIAAGGVVVPMLRDEDFLLAQRAAASPSQASSRVNVARAAGCSAKAAEWFALSHSIHRP